MTFPNDPIKDIEPQMDQYLAAWENLFIPMFATLNNKLRLKGVEVEVRAALLGAVQLGFVNVPVNVKMVSDD